MSHAAAQTDGAHDEGGSGRDWRQLPARSPRAFLVVAATVWFLIYQALAPLSAWLAGLLPLTPKSHLADAVEFFLYDTPKVLLLLTGVVMVMGMINSYFTAERTRALLAGKAEGLGNIMAASLGIVTPFCSCSAVPLFIGIVATGILLVGFVFNAVL